MPDERACVVITAEDGPQAGRVETVGETRVTVQGRRLAPEAVLGIDCAPPYRRLLRRRGYRVLMGREARWPDVLADLEAWDRAHAEVLASGDVAKIGRRATNTLIGRHLVRRAWWRPSRRRGRA